MEQLANLLATAPAAKPDLTTLVPFLVLGLIISAFSFYLKGLVDPSQLDEHARAGRMQNQ